MKCKKIGPGQGTHKPGRWARWSLGAAAAISLATAGASPTVSHAQAPQIHSGELPQYHVIREGDTIWDLSGSYFNDPYEWPRMWSYNPHITNPHWIYPGDVVYLQAVDRAAAQEEAAAQNQAALQKPTEEAPFGLYLPLGGMIYSAELESLGRIIGAPASALMLAQHDTVWIGVGDQAYREDEKKAIREKDRRQMSDAKVQEGDRFAIVRLIGALESEDGDRKGDKYVVLGSLVVTEVPEDEGTAPTAYIEQSWREIERGDLLIPYERQLKVVQPRQADQDVVAQIVDTLDPGFAFGPQQYVFVDRGAEDGVRNGNRFFIYQRYEGLDQLGKETPQEIPWQRVGQVLIVDAREQYSVGVITRSKREIIVGDRLEMYAGH